MLSPRVSRRIDTKGIHLSFLSDSSPESLAWTVISSAPPGTSIFSRRSIWDSGNVGSVSDVSGRLEPCALPVVIGSNGATTSRSANKLAARCRCLRLWIFILRRSNTQQHLSIGQVVLHSPDGRTNRHLQQPRPHEFNCNRRAPDGR